MSHERRFWEDLAAAVNPGWDFSLSDDVVPGEGLLSTYRVYIYTVDTSTVWTMEGATTEQGMERAHATLSLRKEAIPGLLSAAGEQVLACGQDSAARASKPAQQAVTLALLALTETQTYVAAKQTTGSLEGHWLYLVYRLKDGAALSRPAFIRSKRTGFLAPDALLHLVRQVVAMDTAQTIGTVTTQIALGGGAVIDPLLAGPSRKQ